MEEEAFSMPWHKESFIEMVNNKDALYIVASDDNGVIYGCGGLLSVLGEGDICNIVTRADSRGQGIGYGLVEQLISRGRSEYGIEAFTLEVRSSNEIARHLYESFGFECVGMRPGFYDAPKEDAAIYWLR